ncbi:hypothetical protein [Streptomyces lushanensis]|uniref:hypothetical protein n=1 Tax=Streptomyces lushanensis TaxID=1434255 RepID=UPI001472961B|nr:hypothetical protein [Streptomyces lushanensis]
MESRTVHGDLLEGGLAPDGDGGVATTGTAAAGEEVVDLPVGDVLVEPRESR